MTTLTEAEVEAVLLDHLGSLGYTCINDAVSGPDGRAPEREAYSDTFLPSRLRDAIARLNPQIPEDAREDALRKLLGVERPSLIEENRRLHRAVVVECRWNTAPKTARSAVMLCAWSTRKTCRTTGWQSRSLR